MSDCSSDILWVCSKLQMFIDLLIFFPLVWSFVCLDQFDGFLYFSYNSLLLVIVAAVQSLLLFHQVST